MSNRVRSTLPVSKKLLILERLGVQSPAAFLNHSSVTFYEEGDFTICIVVPPELTGTAAGAAKLSPFDEPSRFIGQLIAFRRAMEALFPPERYSDEYMRGLRDGIHGTYSPYVARRARRQH